MTVNSNRKTVYLDFEYTQCDDFAAYLSEMAAKGWHFKEWRAGLVFEKGQPETVQYAAEVFIDGSDYDTRPNVHTEEFAAYCEAAGWQLLDARRKFVILKKCREDAVDIMTPRERLENIAREEKKSLLCTLGLSLAWLVLGALHLIGPDFTDRILFDNYLLTYAVVLFLASCTAVRFLHCLIWKKAADRKLENGEAYRFSTKTDLFIRADSWRSWVTCVSLAAVAVALLVTKQYVLLLVLGAFVAVVQVTGHLIVRFRTSAETNRGIWNFVALLLIIGILAASAVMA